MYLLPFTKELSKRIGLTVGLSVGLNSTLLGKFSFGHFATRSQSHSEIKLNALSICRSGEQCNLFGNLQE